MVVANFRSPSHVRRTVTGPNRPGRRDGHMRLATDYTIRAKKIFVAVEDEVEGKIEYNYHFLKNRATKRYLHMLYDATFNTDAYVFFFSREF